jgi:hypothetical protein
MADRIAELRSRLRRLERELDMAIDEEHRKAEGPGAPRQRFTRAERAGHRSHRIGIFRYLREMRLSSLVAVPATYSVIVAIMLLDLLATLHQWATFPILGIRRVRRADYIAIDRHKLSYLNAIEKLNCIYCGYANGVIAYAREIASRTEQYWCPIKHAKLIRSPHARYPGFLDYGDARGYREKLASYRRDAGES